MDVKTARKVWLSWLTIPGLKKSITAKWMLDKIEEKWPAGEQPTEEQIRECQRFLDDMVKKGLVKIDTTPRYVVDTTALNERFGRL
jgi:ribosomal protein S20